MKSTSTLGPESAVKGRRQNPGQIAKNIGERQSEPQSTARPASLANIFAVWPRFLPSSPTAEHGLGLPFNFPSLDYHLVCYTAVFSVVTQRSLSKYLSASSTIWLSPTPIFFSSSSPPPPPPNADPGPRQVDAFLFSLKIKGLITLAKPSMSTTIFPTNRGSSFFFPFGNLSQLYDRKYESDHPNPSYFPMGKTSSMTAPAFPPFRLARAAGRRTCSDCPPTIHFVLLVRERLSTSNQNGG